MILVTGGTGLLGSHLLFELVENELSVKALTRRKNSILKTRKIFSYYTEQPDELISRIDWIEGDIRDPLLFDRVLENVDLIFHCAGFVSFDPADKKKILEVNSAGTANIVNAALQKNGIRFCHASSIASLGRDKAGGFTDEEDSWKQTSKSSVYSISKFEAEREVWRGSVEGLDVVIVNPSVIIGPGNWEKGSSKFFETVWKGLSFYSSGMNGFVDVRDVARAMILLAESRIGGERFIINSENIAYRQLFDWIADELGKNRPRYRIPLYLSGLIWRAEKAKSFLSGKRPLITKETAATANSSYRFSNEKVRKAINYKFRPIHDSIRDTGSLFLKDMKTELNKNNIRL